MPLPTTVKMTGLAGPTGCGGQPDITNRGITHSDTAINAFRFRDDIGTRSPEGHEDKSNGMLHRARPDVFPTESKPRRRQSGCNTFGGCLPNGSEHPLSSDSNVLGDRPDPPNPEEIA